MENNRNKQFFLHGVGNRFIQFIKIMFQSTFDVLDYFLWWLIILACVFIILD